MNITQPPEQVTENPHATSTSVVPFFKGKTEAKTVQMQFMAQDLCILKLIDF